MASIYASYIDSNTFTISGTTDYTAQFHAGRRIKADCGVNGYKYGTISGSSYSTNTTVVIYPDTGNDLTTNLTEVWFGIVGKTNGSLPDHSHLNNDGQGGLLTEASISDLNKYTTEEIDTISGSIVAQIPTDFYTTSEVDTISGSLHQEILTISGGSGVTAHSDLTELDYSSSGHTGFQPTGDYATNTQLSTTSGNIVSQIPSLTGYATEMWTNTNFVDNSEMTTISGALNTKLDTHKSSADHDGRYYTENEITTISGNIVSQIITDHGNLAGLSDDDHTQYHNDARGDARYYTQAQITTISGNIVSQIPTNFDDRYYTEAEVNTISGAINTKFSSYYTSSQVDTISGSIVSQIPAAYTNEMAQDAVGTIMSGTGSVVVTYNDATNTITVSGSATSSGITDIVNDTTPQLGGDLDTNAKNISLTPTAGGSDLTACGLIATMTVDVNATGVGAALFMASDGNFEEADASAITTMPCTALALETGTGSKKVLLFGYMRNDAWNWTPGPVIYVSATTGALTQSIPATAGDQVQLVGYATHADRIYFNPNLIMGEVY